MKYKLIDGTVLEEAAALARGQSYSSIQSQVYDAINKNIRKGIDMDGDDDGDADMNDYAYVVDLFPDVAIYSMNGCLFSVKYTIKKGDVTLGSPVRVEQSYTPVKESGRVPVVALGSRFTEASYNKSTGKLTVTVIQPGFNTSKSRFYKESALKRDYKVFEGSKMFVNHQTAVEEKARPEGDVNQWVANLQRTWVESNGTIMGEAVVIDPTFKAKLDNLAEAKLLGEMGISIRAIGEAYEDEVDGVRTNVVESFIAARSVDFVTYPGAGGRVEAIEADATNPDDLELVNVEELRRRRPDLVLLIESRIREEHQVMKTAEQLTAELNEANQKLAAEKQRADVAESNLKKQTASAELTKLLSESKLPDVAKDRLRERFKEAVDTTGMKEAIEAEEKYIQSLGAKPAGKTVTNMGESTQQTDGTSTDAAAGIATLKESFIKMGLSKEEAEIAAKGR